MRTFISLCLACLLLFTACATTREVVVEDAQFELYLDVNPLRITAGHKRVRIEHKDYHTYRCTLEYIQPRDIYTLKTHLIRRYF